MKKYLVVALALAVSGCTSELLVKSDPEFATIYSGNQNFGAAPVYLSYKITKQDRKIGFIIADTLTARWISGATLKMPIQLNFKEGKHHEITLIRPADYPNVNLDANYVQERTKKEIEMKLK
jgi:hypothetical protein